MNYFFLDASAVVKRYIPETGTLEMNYFFARVPPHRMLCLFEGGGEVIFVFSRSRNERKVTAIRFNQIKQRFLTEVIYRVRMIKVFPTKNQISRSWDFIERHSINSTDAILLQCALDRVNELRIEGDNLVLVSSDKRLLNAARSEGLPIFNPETDNQAALDILIDPP